MEISAHHLHTQTEQSGTMTKTMTADRDDNGADDCHAGETTIADHDYDAASSSLLTTTTRGRIVVGSGEGESEEEGGGVRPLRMMRHAA